MEIKVAGSKHSYPVPGDGLQEELTTVSQLIIQGTWRAHRGADNAFVVCNDPHCPLCLVMVCVLEAAPELALSLLGPRPSSVAERLRAYREDALRGHVADRRQPGFADNRIRLGSLSDRLGRSGAFTRGAAAAERGGYPLTEDWRVPDGVRASYDVSGGRWANPPGYMGPDPEGGYGPHYDGT